MKAQVQVTQVSNKLRWQAPLSSTQDKGAWRLGGGTGYEV
jgi:hypothetical protein